MKPYYQDAFVTLYHADCREMLASIDADLCLTDPPYGVQKQPRTYAGKKGRAVAWDGSFDPSWAHELNVRVLGLMPGVLNLPRCPLVIGPLAYRWTLAAHVTNGMTRGPFGYGNWIPCLIYAVEAVSLYQQVTDVARVAVSGERPDHPSPKPYSAVAWFLSLLPGATVLDPFVGSGTTLLAAKQAGRYAIGIEIDEAYCEVAARRLSQGMLDLGVA